MLLRDHILLTLKKIERHAGAVDATAFMHMLQASANRGQNDTRWLRERQGEESQLAEVTDQASLRFRGGVMAHSQRD